jgi:hypothetical protein
MQQTLTNRRFAATPRETLFIYVGGVAGFAFLAGLMPLADLLTGPIGLLLTFTAALGAAWFVNSRVRQGGSAAGATLELALVGAFTFLVLYGVMWYFLTYLPSSPSLVQFRLGSAYHSP